VGLMGPRAGLRIPDGRQGPGRRGEVAGRPGRHPDLRRHAASAGWCAPQNPISFAGSGDRGVNQLLVQPILQVNLPEGWYIGAGDLNWTFDWKENGAARIPLALQVGRVMPIFGPLFNLAVEPFYLVAHEGPSPRWGIRFGFSLLLPESCAGVARRSRRS
jgi:hypothetical protein